jgi:16S rRNA (cytosine1407-C5)-methyltransferase
MARKRTPPLALDPQAAAMERVRPLVSAEDFAAILEEIQQPLPPAIRLNPLKTDSDTLAGLSQRYGWQTEPIAWCAEGYRLPSATTSPGGTLEHHMGQYYIQEAASMLPPELFYFSGIDQPLVLDMAASPGGKTAHLISRIGDHGLVIANDSSADRIQALRLVLLTWGGLHQAVTQFPGERWGEWYPETFDAVLLDAPCSMQGLRGAESHTIRPITDREITGLARRQLALLTSALQAVKPGGQIVYSTCTLTPEENEGVLDHLLRAFPDMVRVENMSSRIPTPAPALTTAPDGSVYEYQIANALRLFPHRLHTAGFFAARLTKTASIASPTSPAPNRPISRAGFQPLGTLDAKQIVSLFIDAYGFDLSQFCEADDMVLWQRDQTVHLFPAQFLDRFAGLPVSLLGMPMGDWQGSTFVPSHEWAARFGRQCRTGWSSLDDNQAQRWLAGADIETSAENLPPICLIKDNTGRFIGRARVGHGKLKNLLPRRFFS